MFQVKVVVWTVDICGYNRRIVSTMLCVIRPVENVEHAFGVCVSLVGRMRRAIMHHGFVNGRPGPTNVVRKDAGRKAGHEFFDAERVGTLVDVEGHAHVSVEEIGSGGHVVKESAYNGGEMNDMSGPMTFKYLLCRVQGTQVAVGAA